MEKEENQNITSTDQSQELENAEKNTNEEINKIQPQSDVFSSDEKGKIKEPTPEERIAELEAEVKELTEQLDTYKRKLGSQVMNK